jgi:tetratricopeptide (TPR) repeat protein
MMKVMADKTSLMKEAQKHLSKGQIDKAITVLDKLIRESPDGNAYNTIGDLYLKKADKKNAIDSYHKAANFFRHEGFSLKALALYKKVLNINPTDTDALYALGELNEEKGLLPDAIKYYLATADSMAKQGKKEKILDIYEKILSLSPSNIPLRNKVAEIFLKEGLKTDASKEYVFIAKLYDEKGDVHKSKEYYQKVLDLHPLNKDATLGISHLLEKTGEIAKAIEQTKEATALFPNDMDIILRCAELLLLEGNTGSAKEYLFRVTENEPANIKCKRLLGELYLKDGLKEQAWIEYLPVLDEMILEEKYADAINLLQSFKEIDQVETGKRLVSLYRQLGENDHLVAELTSLGDALYDKGMKDDALSWYREALEINPNDANLKEKAEGIASKPELKKEAVDEHAAVTGEKTVAGLLTEADIFSRYGLLNEAKRILEGLKLRDPENIDVHMRLKSVYMDTSDKEAGVTECLILNELYMRSGDEENAERMLKDAYEISPDDPRLAERKEMALFDSKSFAATGKEERAGTPSGGQGIGDYDEKIAEADFYVKQGLIQEASRVLEELQKDFPDDKGISEKLDSLNQIPGESRIPEVTETIEKQPESFELPAADSIDSVSTETVHEEKIKEEIEPKPEKEEYEDITLTDKDLVEAEEMPEPELDNDVLEIFDEFKKGIEKELGDEDSETHYNLGIAYKEMGLIDDAIKAFQTARTDKKRFIQASTMLGVCYVEKGMYSLAIDSLNNAFKEIDSSDDSYWPIKYDLAEAYEKNKNLKESLDLYTGVYGWDAKFRDVSEKVSQLRAQLAKSGEREKSKGRKDRVSYL